MAVQKPEDLVATLAHHDAAIGNLGGRMSGVESGLRTLQGEVHSGFTTLGSKLDKLDAEPRFDFHKAVGTVLSLAVLFSMVVGGVIWVTTNQFSGVVAKQEVMNERVEKRMLRAEERLEKLSDTVGWLPKEVTKK